MSHLDESLIADFVSTFSRLKIITDPQQSYDYLCDESSLKPLKSSIVVFPKTTRDVSALCQYASQHNLPIVPRGAGSGLSGGCVPLESSVVICLEDMNEILEVDQDNLCITAQAGVITGHIRDEAAKYDLFYPPIPASVDYCSIGGNIATNAGGLCAVKYGVTRKYLLGLTCVLYDGRVIQTGGKYAKLSTGYELTQLICGSEGTLGIVTEVIVRVQSAQKYTSTMLIPGDSMQSLSDLVALLTRSPDVLPPTIELIPKAAVECVLSNYPQTRFPIENTYPAYLLLELDASSESEQERQLETFLEILPESFHEHLVLAQSETQRTELWELRKNVRNAIVAMGEYVEADAVVARSCITQLVEAAYEVGQTHQLKTICYGHAGDGNLHTYFLKGSISDAQWPKLSETVLKDFFSKCIDMGGNISGEHGIGALKRNYLHQAYSKDYISLLRNIKRAFDPKGKLNPGKVLPPSDS